MSTPDPKPAAAPAANAAKAKPSNAGRYLFLLVLGLVLGAVATVMLLRAIDARKDHFPESLMVFKGWHMGQLKADMETNRCNATDVLPHLQALRMTANDLESAFPDLRDDERFRTAASAMRAAADKAIAAPPLSCPAVSEVLKSIGGTCKGCHQDFKG